MKRIVVLTQGLWRLRHEIGVLTGMEVVRWDRLPRPSFDAVAGWGHAPTSTRARRIALRSGKPYLALEDGLLRSVRPGPGQKPMSMVLDRTGIYYAANAPSDLSNLAADPRWFTPDVAERAQAGIALIQRLRLSKYNSGPEKRLAPLGPGQALRRVMVIDQVRDDASVRGALADQDSFAAMLAAALDENPGAEVVLKLHPDSLSGRRRGYFDAIRPSDRIRLVAETVNPWSLLDAMDQVYTVSSGLGFEAALAAKPVVCFGSPFYAGWGFTDDRGRAGPRAAAATPQRLFAAFYLRYSRYFDAYRRTEISFEEACEQLAWLRDRFVENSPRAVCHCIAPWKRRSFDKLLDGPSGPPLHIRNARQAVARARAEGGALIAWASRADSGLSEACAAAGVRLVRAEDGFVRSAGLGASFVLPLSLVFDGRGIYYDSRAPSDLEWLLMQGDFSPELIERARSLRAALVRSGTTKYNIRAQPGVAIASDGRRVVLVPGQVEDDASIRTGSPRIASNEALLRAVRARHPDAYIVYKPHPDVEAGIRKGRIDAGIASGLADRVAAQAPILELIAQCEHVETITSLAGFEALLRGKRVATHGQPFYAGWGLTEDLCPVPRRTRRLSLDELTAAALILYPRYLDPESGLPCGPELLVERLAAARQAAPGIASRLARIGRLSFARALHAGRSVARRG